MSTRLRYDRLDRGRAELSGSLPGCSFWGPVLLVLAVVLHLSLCEWRLGNRAEAGSASGEETRQRRPRRHEGVQLVGDSRIVFSLHARDMFLYGTEHDVGRPVYQWDKAGAMVTGVAIPLALAGIGVSMLMYSFRNVFRGILRPFALRPP